MLLMVWNIVPVGSIPTNNQARIPKKKTKSIEQSLTERTKAKT